MQRPPSEGRDDLGIPGADRGSSDRRPSPGDTEEQRRDDLADRVEDGPAAGNEPDVLPDVQVPEHQM